MKQPVAAEQVHLAIGAVTNLHDLYETFLGTKVFVEEVWHKAFTDFHHALAPVHDEEVTGYMTLISGLTKEILALKPKDSVQHQELNAKVEFQFTSLLQQLISMQRQMEIKQNRVIPNVAVHIAGVSCTPPSTDPLNLPNQQKVNYFDWCLGITGPP